VSGKAILIVVFGIMSVSFVSYETIMTHSNESNNNIVNYYYEQQAYNISQTGISMTMMKMETDPTWDKGFYYVDLFGGKLYTKILDTLFEGNKAVKVTSIGIMGYNTKYEKRETSIVYLKPNGGFIPPTVKAAFTSNKTVLALGSLTIDGRDHDLEGNLIATAGKLGVWTTGEYISPWLFSVTKLASTLSGTDYGLQTGENDNVRLENQEYEGGFPSDPSEILGGEDSDLSEQDLIKLAKSGVNGSQYVTDPDELKGPLSGITYVELKTEKSKKFPWYQWESMDITGSGILIVHNKDGNSLINNITSGTFKGLVIADNISGFNATVIGGVVNIGNDPYGIPLFSALSYGTGSIMYSNEAIVEATKILGGGEDKESSKNFSVLGWWN